MSNTRKGDANSNGSMGKKIKLLSIPSDPFG